MTQLIRRFCNDENGATAIEYGLIAAILGMGLVASLTNLQTALIGLFSGIEGQIPE